MACVDDRHRIDANELREARGAQHRLWPDATHTAPKFRPPQQALRSGQGARSGHASANNWLCPKFRCTAGVTDFHSQAMPVNAVFSQIVVPQACPERPDLSTGPAGGVEILALCEWRLAIACAVRRAPRAARWCRCDVCLLYTSPSPRDLSTSRMPSSA